MLLPAPAPLQVCPHPEALGLSGQAPPTFPPSEKPKKEGGSRKEEDTDDKWAVDKGKDHKGVSLGLAAGPTQPGPCGRAAGLPEALGASAPPPVCVVPQGPERARSWRRSGLQ